MTRRDGGFTLVETLVALTVVSLLAAALYQGLQLGNRAWSGLNARAAAIDEIGVTQRILRQALDQAYPLPAPTAQGYRVDFRGEAQGVSFWTPPPDVWRYPGGFIPARISLVESGGRKTLVLTFSERNGALTASEDIVLLRDVADIGLDYFSAAGGWSATWTDRPTLPGLIRLRVVFTDGDRRRWPDLVVAPKITLDAECAPDPLTQRCRGR
jgi:general secretion pathway protein J